MYRHTRRQESNEQNKTTVCCLIFFQGSISWRNIHYALKTFLLKGDVMSTTESTIVENNVEYKALILKYVNVSGGAVTVNLSTQAGQPKASYSTGPNFSSYGGLEIDVESGISLPISSLQVNPTIVTVAVQSSSGGSGAVNFGITLWVAAQPNIQSFILTLQPGMEGITVSAEFDGRKGQALSPGTPLAVFWNPL